MSRGAKRSLVALVVVAMAGTACGTTGETGSPPPAQDVGPNERVVTGGTLRAAISFPPKAGLAIDTADAFTLAKAGAVESLVEADATGKTSPLLATSWDRQDDLTWRFTLRNGVAFHDGTPLTAASVASALGFVAASPTPPRAFGGLKLTMEPVDEITLRVTTDRPDPILPLRLSSPNAGILAPAAYQSTPPSAVGTGTGPFRIVRYEPNQFLTVERYDGYWGEKARLDGAELRFLPDPASRVAALRSGEVDVAEGVPAAQVPVLADVPGVTLETIALPRTTTLYTNVAKGALAQRPVREAVSMAIDREALTTTVLEGSAASARGYFGPAVPWGDAPNNAKADPEAARKLLSEAGFAPGALRLRLWTYPARAELPVLATAVKDMLERAGIGVDVEVAEYTAQEPRVLAGEHDLFLLSRSYLTDMADAESYLRSDFGCTGAFNLNRFCDPAFDSLLDGIATASDRQDVFRRAAAVLAEGFVGIPVSYDRSRTAISDRVRGFTPDPLEHALLTTGLGVAG